MKKMIMFTGLALMLVSSAMAQYYDQGEGVPELKVVGIVAFIAAIAVAGFFLIKKK